MSSPSNHSAHPAQVPRIGLAATALVVVSALVGCHGFPLCLFGTFDAQPFQHLIEGDVNVGQWHGAFWAVCLLEAHGLIPSNGSAKVS